MLRMVVVANCKVENRPYPLYHLSSADLSDRKMFGVRLFVINFSASSTEQLHVT